MSDSGTCGCGKSAGSCSTAKTETTSKKGSTTVQNGKGDAPRNVSQKFRSNYNGINWKSGGKLKKGEKFVKVYA